MREMVQRYRECAGQEDLLSRRIDVRVPTRPITDNNEESDASSTFQEEWTPPQLSLDLERVPNIAYARDQDWAWMAGLFSDRRDRG